MDLSKTGTILFVVGLVLIAVNLLLNAFLVELGQLIGPFILPVVALIGIAIGLVGISVEKSQFFILSGLALLVGLFGFFLVFTLIDEVTGFAGLGSFNVYGIIFQTFNAGLSALIGSAMFVVGLKQLLASFE